jgi:hypothetical protein
MDSSVSAKDEIWFLRVCHHVSNALYLRMLAKIVLWLAAVQKAVIVNVAV